MALKTVIKKDGDHIELYYQDTLLGTIKLAGSNRTTQSDILIDLKKEVQIRCIKKKKQIQVDEDFGNR